MSIGPILGTIALACTVSQTSPAIKVPFKASLTETTANVILGWEKDGNQYEAKWEFRAIPDRPGLLVRADNGATRSEFQLVNGMGDGPVVSLAARGYFIKDAWHMLVLGIGSLNAAKDAIEYRLVVYHALESMPKPERWMHTDPLLIRPASQPMDGMSIAFPGGDSVLLGLHDLTRGAGEGDAIESHFFVNHCPMAHVDGKIPASGTEYYTVSVEGGGITLEQLETRRELESENSKYRTGKP
jgi:hypothetical protein